MEAGRRKKVRWVAEALGIALAFALLLGLRDLFSDDSVTDKLLGLLGLVLVSLLIVAPAFYGLRQQWERDEETNRKFWEDAKRQEERDERWRAYEENRKREERILKDRILDDLRAIASGEKVRLDTEAMDAVKALQMRQGDHPQTLAAWAPLLEDLRAAPLDHGAIKSRIDDLLYPETLEDVEALKKTVIKSLESVRGGRERLDAAALDAAKSLNEIRARDARIRHEEQEAEAEARRRQEASDKNFAAAMDEMSKASVRNILRMHGLPETALDSLPPHEALAHIRALRLLRELEGNPGQVRPPDS